MTQNSFSKNILITGGTVFVSRYAAKYYTEKGYHVYVLNRNTRPQPKGVTLIEADRHHLDDRLRDYHFDAVLDITAYTAEDISSLLSALGSYDAYILISSSAVYPEYAPQPFTENTKTGANKFWGNYGIQKIDAEQILLERKPDAYILRPPYLY
ncbi:MAG: NAD-dependent epimerase/dehydratase family protein, partial [Lachnospiraceae bacterium]|nr:NAD-dependent epimerase/dehydratase family protein [Lachnospiraceae bacterium]